MVFSLSNCQFQSLLHCEVKNNVKIKQLTTFIITIQQYIFTLNIYVQN